MTQRKLEEIQAGERITGTVSNVELAGAFVDVGAEVPGFLHISQLQVGKVNRVGDALSAGQEVELWVSRVDPAARRLELSMRRPVTLQWGEIRPGMQFRGEVTRVEPFGVFVEIGAERPGLIHVSELSDEYVRDPREQVRVGEEITASVIEVDPKKRQIRLSLKAVQPEIGPEPAEPPLPTAMELALRKAMETAPPRRRADKQRPKNEPQREELEQILQRTLSSRLRSSTEADEEGNTKAP
jgi:ribosomal protein S1